MIELIPKIPAFKLSRRFGFPKVLPVNLTVSLTNRCNSRCITCNIYDKEVEVEEFSFDEFKKTFESIGTSPYWITFSGGEPFSRKDIVEICRSAYENCRPRIINIPTNGLLTERIVECVEEILRSCPNSKVIVNLSIDAIGNKHDEIRGIKSGFKRAVETYKKLRSLSYPNFILGIHTVISKYNVKDIPSIYGRLKDLKPDSYITEIAEERIELGTIGTDITPSPEDYKKAIDFIIKEMFSLDLKGIPKITRAFRTIYYQMVKSILRDKREVIPCYAALASCQIASNGEIWACCIKAESMGNLREVGYDFTKVWFSERAKRLREDIKKRRCFCPLANASYTNMLFSIKTLLKVIGLILNWRINEKNLTEEILLDSKTIISEKVKLIS